MTASPPPVASPPPSTTPPASPTIPQATDHQPLPFFPPRNFLDNLCLALLIRRFLARRYSPVQRPLRQPGDIPQVKWPPVQPLPARPRQPVRRKIHRQRLVVHSLPPPQKTHHLDHRPVLRQPRNPAPGHPCKYAHIRLQHGLHW